MKTERLVEDNVRMAFDIANRFRPTTLVDFDDIRQMALIGLYKAAKSFNPDKGYEFSTYAYKIMRNEILTEIKRHKTAPSIEELELDPEDIMSNPEEISLGSLDRVRVVLDEREYTIIKMTVEGYSQAEISRAMGLSQSQVSRMFLKSKKKITEVLDDGNTTDIRG